MKSLGLACAFLLAAACTPTSSINDASDDGGGSSNGGSNDGGSSSTNNDGGSGAGFITEGGSTGNSMKCASEAIEAEIAPLTMFITFDKSGSMGENGGGKWAGATQALKGFFADPGAADLQVALRFFPEGQCDSPACNVDACGTPAVDVGMLTSDPAPADTQEAALIAAINSRTPGGGTPMSAALEGAISWSTDYLGANPDHKVVVILVTDGEPSGCQNDIGYISNQAMIGYVAGVPTYTVGLAGSNTDSMMQIAAAGGGTHFVVGNGNTQADLLAALQAIRGEQLACEIPVPQPTEGEFDPTLVNVTYSPGDGGAPVTIGKVDGEAQCNAGFAWYYDDNANPTTIILCPAACEVVRDDDNGKIEVVLGCQTIPA